MLRVRDISLHLLLQFKQAKIREMVKKIPIE